MGGRVSVAAGWALGMAMWGAGALPASAAIGIQLPPADDRFEEAMVKELTGFVQSRGMALVR